MDRFDKFTDRARKVLTLAQDEAQRFNHNYIGTEHLLLGLVREGEGVAARVLENMNVELPKVRTAVEFIIGRGDRPVVGEVGLTPRAKRVIELAIDEARRLGHNYIGTEHLLLGLVREGEGIAAGVLESLGVNLDKVRHEVIRVLSQSSATGSPASETKRSSKTPTVDQLGINLTDAARAGKLDPVIGRGDRQVTGEVSLTPRSKKVVELAVDEARRLNHAYIGTEHLLLGLIREGEGIAAGVLESLGVNLEDTRKQIVDVVSQSQQPPVARIKARLASLPAVSDVTGSKDSVITCRIPSGDLEALDALIEAGIRTTRSDAAAWLIHAGIQANLDLFDKVYTTVAEIKRLRDQAQSAAKDLESKGKPEPPPEAPPSSKEPA